MSDAFTLVAPLAGWAAPLSETPDPVFAEKMLGDGIAIDPTLGELRAPCDGVVIGLHDSLHAVTVRATNGAEVLLHVGLETVKCCGEGFEALVEVGAEVTAGELLLKFDLESLARNAASLMSPVVVVNGHAFAVEGQVTGREVALGEPIMIVRPLVAATAATGGASETRRRRVRVGLPHGLHARPAALVAHEAGKFAAQIALEIGDRRANARSPVSVMALAIRAGDEVEIVAVGSDAVEALEALADAMADGRTVAAPPPIQPTAPAAPPVSPVTVLAGVPAAPGFAIGAAVRLIEPEAPVKTEADSPAVERAALDAALQAVTIVLAGRVATEAGQSREIAEAHLAFLADPELRRDADAAINAGASAGVAWSSAIGGYVDQLRGAGDARVMERAADLTDLQRQVLLQLSGETAAPVALPDNAIVLADDILPSQLMELDPKRVAGLAISRGGPTSHVAILAAAMNIPAVVALGPRLLSIEDGALVILDGDEGRLQVAPKPAEIAAAQTRLFERRQSRARAEAAAHEPCRLADGTRIEVFANLGAVAEAPPAVESGAEGCGLLRTEFLFMDRTAAPDEAEQHAAYQAIADALAGRPLVVRTLDVGADKPVTYLPLPPQANPALGVRGVRVSFAWPELFRAQLRAILGVTPFGQAQIMLPMVASLGELTAARAIAAELAAEFGVALPPIGVMIETPAAAVTADLLAAEADFLSIGTNDLAQYALAMDRTSAELAAQVDALHPAVLRLIRDAVAGAALHSRTVAVCGSLASEVAAAPILIGLGVTELSAAPAAIPDLKAALRELTLGQCREIAERALMCASAAEVRALRLTAVGAGARVGAMS